MIPTGLTTNTKLLWWGRQAGSQLYLDLEHEPVGRVQDEAEQVGWHHLQEDWLGTASMTGPLLLHPQDDSQSVEGHQADQEVWGGTEDLGVGHQHLQQLGQGLGGDLHRGVSVAQADHGVEHDGVQEVDQVGQGYRLQVGVEQTLVSYQARVQEDYQQEGVPEDTEEADHGINTTIDHGVDDLVFISSNTWDEVHGRNDHSALPAW